MAVFQRLMILLVLLAVSISCQFPLAPRGSQSPGLHLSFTLSQPASRDLSQSRLLLPTAKTLKVTLTRNTVVIDTQTLALAAGRANYTADLEARIPHVVTAQAYDASGSLVFQGATTVTLYGDRAVTLYLFPVTSDGSAWTTIAASAQPLSGVFGAQTTPAAGTSLSYLVDLGSTATSFTFAPHADLELYAQKLDGTLVNPLPATITPADLGGQTAFWATYYQKGTSTVGNVGAFVIPLTSLTLPTTYEIGQGGTVDLSTLLVKNPPNATDGGVEWLVADASVATVALTGVLTAGAPPSTPASTIVTVRKTDGTLPTTATLTVWGPEFSRLSNLKVSVDAVDQGIPFVQTNLTYPLATTKSATLTQTITLAATTGAAGQTLAWSTDGATWTPMTTVPTDVVLGQGANDVRVRVVAPNGVDTNTYHLTLTKVVLPSALSLSPSSYSEGIDAPAAALFTPTVSLAQADDKTVTWSVDRPDLATIHPTTGVVTPLLKGVVVVTATSNAVPGLAATASLTLTPSQAELKNANLLALTAQVDGVSQPLAYAPTTLTYPLADAQSTALTQTLTLTATEAQAGQTLAWSADGAAWTPMTTALPTNIPVAQGANDVRVRVVALNGTDTGTYHVQVTKVILPTSLALAPTTATLATNAPPAGLFTATFTLVQTDDQTISWSVDRTDLATIDPVTGVLTPLLPGEVVVTATSNADAAVSATAALTLTPSQYLLKASNGAFWSDLTTSPVRAPFGTIAIAGNATSLWAMTPGSFKVFNGGVWQSSTLVPPALTQWFVVDDQGMVICATPTRLYHYESGFWSSSIPVPPVGIQGLMRGETGVSIWGSDGKIWSFNGALWTKQAIVLPLGTTAITGTPTSLVALAGSQFREFQAGVWTLMPAAALPQTADSTFAFGQFVSLIVR